MHPFIQPLLPMNHLNAIKKNLILLKIIHKATDLHNNLKEGLSAHLETIIITDPYHTFVPDISRIGAITYNTPTSSSTQESDTSPNPHTTEPNIQYTLPHESISLSSSLTTDQLMEVLFNSTNAQPTQLMKAKCKTLDRTMILKLIYTNTYHHSENSNRLMRFLKSSQGSPIICIASIQRTVFSFKNYTHLVNNKYEVLKIDDVADPQNYITFDSFVMSSYLHHIMTSFTRSTDTNLYPEYSYDNENFDSFLRFVIQQHLSNS